MNNYELRLGDCLQVMKTLEPNSVDLILTDPPYFKVKDEPWDNQWSKPDQFLSWMDEVLEQFQRILKPNGSLYLFASPQMVTKVETLVSNRFDVLNNIRWYKTAGWHNKTRKESLRQYLTPWEACIFAEHHNREAADDEVRGFVFEPIRAYLAGERDKAGFTTRKVAEAFQKKTGSRTVTGMAGHWFETVQWVLPTSENYEWLRQLFGEGFLLREYEDLRCEYEDLRCEYEDLRRPFSVTAKTAHNDLWTFETVSHYKGKHPCEKPLAMLEHIINASSQPGAVVFDAFAGSGSTGEASLRQGRRFIGCEMSQIHHSEALDRLVRASTSPLVTRRGLCD